MKKFKLQSILMALCLVMTAGLWSCNDEDVDGDGPFLEVLPEKLTFEDTGGAQTLTVKANRAWEAAFVESGLEWISFTPKKGEGEGTIEVTVLANGGAERTANLKVTSSINSATIRIVQAAAGGSVIGGDPLYQENCGSDVYKIDANGNKVESGGKWPYVDQYTQYFNPNWEKGGTLDQSGVTYSGSSSNVSNSGANFAPPAGGPFSGAPYIGMNTASAVFTIENINIDSKTNFTFKFGAIFQERYTGGLTFGAVASNTFTLEASLDGTTWAPLTYTATQESTSNWYMVTSEFKVPAGTAHLSIRYKTTNLAPSEQGYRFDDFKLYEGGNGALIGEGGGDEPSELQSITIAELNEKITSEAVAVGKYKVKGIVVTDMADKNYSSGGFSIQTEGSNTAGNGILVFKYGEKFEDAAGNPLFNLGDEVEIDLSEAKIQAYKGAKAQEDPNSPACNELIVTGPECITKKRSGVSVAATTITPDKIAAFQSMYVQIEQAQSKETTIGEWEATTYIFNVNDDGSKEFKVYVGYNATLIGQRFLTGNGTIKGIAYVYGGSKSANSVAQLVPRDYEDVSGLTGERAGAPVSLSFGTPSLSGTLTAEEAVANAKIVIPYSNAKGTESYNITVTVGGAAAAGITVTAVNPTLAAGNGNIEIPVTGTPTTAGKVTFTINGVTGLTDNTVEAIVNAIIADFSTNSIGLPTEKPADPTEVEYTIDGYKWSIFYAYYGTYSGKGYLMVPGKNVDNKGYVVLPVLADKAITSVTVTTGTNASTSVEVALQVETDGSYTEVVKQKLETKDADFVFNVPSPVKGAKYRLIVTNNYNAQFTKISIATE